MYVFCTVAATNAAHTILIREQDIYLVLVFQ